MVIFSAFPLCRFYSAYSMTFCRLNRLFNGNFAAGLKLLKNSYSTQLPASSVKTIASAPNLNVWCASLYKECSEPINSVKSSFRTTSLVFNIERTSRQVLDCPKPSKAEIFRLPTNSSISKVDVVINENIVEAPALDDIVEKRAARLIVIRRRKMKKHKLKKLRKKMKFEWAKVRQRRELRKEKAFQAMLIAQIKEAEAFDAAQYVADKLRMVQDKKFVLRD